MANVTDAHAQVATLHKQAARWSDLIVGPGTAKLYAQAQPLTPTPVGKQKHTPLPQIRQSLTLWLLHDHVHQCAHNTPAVVNVEAHLTRQVLWLAGLGAQDHVVAVVLGTCTADIS